MSISARVNDHVYSSVNDRIYRLTHRRVFERIRDVGYIAVWRRVWQRVHGAMIESAK